MLRWDPAATFLQVRPCAACVPARLHACVPARPPLPSPLLRACHLRLCVALASCCASQALQGRMALQPLHTLCCPCRAALWEEVTTLTGMRGAWVARCRTSCASTPSQVGAAWGKLGDAVLCCVGRCAACLPACLPACVRARGCCPCRELPMRQQQRPTTAHSPVPSPFAPRPLPAEDDRRPLLPLPVGALVKYDVPLRLAGRAAEGPCEPRAGWPSSCRARGSWLLQAA